MRSIYRVIAMSPAIHRIAELPEQAANRQSQSLAALAITLGLVVAGVFLADTLHAQAAFQDCVLSGSEACQIGVP